MRKFFIFLFVTSLGLAALAQVPDVKYRMGAVKKVTSKLMFVYTEPLGFGDNVCYGQMLPMGVVYSGTTKSKEYKLFSLAKDMNTIKYADVEREQDGMPTEHEFLLKVKDKIFLFVSFQNQKIKKTVLLAKSMNKKTMLPEGKLKPVTEVDYSKANKYKRTTFSYEYSPDSSKILIYHALSDKDGMLLDYGFTVLDENLNTLWNDDKELPIGDNKVYAFDKLAISNSGDIYVLCKIYDSKKQFKNASRYKSKWGLTAEVHQQGVYSYSIFSLKNKGDDRNQHPLELSDKFVRSLQLGTNDQNEAICAGLYGANQSLSVIGSCSFILGNKPGSAVKAHDAPFDINLITKGLDTKDAAELKSDMKNGEEFEGYLYNPEKLIFGKDGNFWFACEQSRKVLKTQQNGNNPYQVQVDHKDGVFLVAMGADGSITWQNKLAKTQKTIEIMTLYSSIMVHAMNDNLYVIYNEIPLTFIGDAKLRSSAAYIAIYDKQGKEKIQKLFGYKDFDGALMPRYSWIVDNKTMVVTGGEDKKYRFAELKFE